MFKSKAHKSARGTLSAIVVGSALLLATSASAATTTTHPDGTSMVSDGAYTFANFQLGGLDAEYCPDPNSPCQNHAAEPAIRADKFGNFFGSSENGITSGTEAWKSIDGGRHYVHLPSPNKVSNLPIAPNPVDLSPAGGDTDLATASAKNSSGIYNVYISSLEAANTAVSTSTDGGHTWSLNATAAKFAGQDREWIAADGTSKVCISYVSAAGIIISPLGLHVECSYDAGTTFTQIGDAISPTTIDPRVGFKIGNMMIDQNSNPGDLHHDTVYQTFAAGTVSDAANPNPTGFHVVWMGVSTDGGQNFTDYQVYNDPVITHDYAHNFTNVSVDQAGNVYSFFSDDHFVYYKFSTDHGVTWQPGGATGAPIKVSRTPATTAIFPWSAAGTAGKVDLVYYGTNDFSAVGASNYPLNDAWNVYFAQNLNAISAPSSWTQVVASPINHFGAVCEGGVGCTGNRDLFDDFGVAVRPSTGLASIIYSDDQFDQYNHTLTYPSSCTQANNNTGSCDHTSIATQTSGPGTSSNGGGGGGGCHEGDSQGGIQGKSGGSASFQSDEDSCEDNDQDSEQMKDPGASTDFHSTSVQSVVFDDTVGTMTSYGQGLNNGKPVTFVIQETAANGLTPAIYSIQLSDGYTNSGTLLTGSVTLK
jgi:hypothetical protein